MRKIFIFATILLSTVLFAPTSLSQNLTQWESEIYYAYLDILFDFTLQGTWNNACINLANRYGITSEQLYNIADKAYMQQPTDWEWQVGDDYWGRYFGLPKEATHADYNRVLSEVAGKYGISVNRLKDIAFRTSWDW